MKTENSIIVKAIVVCFLLGLLISGATWLGDNWDRVPKAFKVILWIALAIPTAATANEMIKKLKNPLTDKELNDETL